MPRSCPFGAETAASLIKSRARKLRGYVPAVQVHDVDGVHDMRVTSRRLRAILSEHKRYIKKAARKSFQRQIKKITKLLGNPRELDVTIALLESHRKSFHGPGRQAIAHAIRVLQKRRAAYSPDCETACALVQSRGFKRALAELFEAINPKGPCYVEQAPDHLNESYATLMEAYHRWLKSHQDDRLHQVRIAFKKLRYSCEVYEPLYGKPMKRFIRKLKAAQEHLGEWNDYRVSVLLMRDAEGSATPTAAGGYPEVYAVMDSIIHELRSSFEVDAQRFFGDKEIKAVQNLFARPTAVCCNGLSDGSPASKVR